MGLHSFSARVFLLYHEGVSSSVVSTMGFGSWGLAWRDCYDDTESMVIVGVDSGSEIETIDTFNCYIHFLALRVFCGGI